MKQGWRVYYQYSLTKYVISSWILSFNQAIFVIMEQFNKVKVDNITFLSSNEQQNKVHQSVFKTNMELAEGRSVISRQNVVANKTILL